MEQNLQHIFLKKFLNKEDDKGFSLIELVVVISVLAVLAAIALPTFTCITRKAKATAALAAMKQIQIECAVKQEEEEGTATFVSSNLQGYEIESEGSNSCNGASGTGLIRAIPNETDELPTFILATNTNELTCSFRGATGTNFTDCLDLICGDGGSSGSSVLRGDSTGNGSVEVVANLPPNESTLFGPDSGLSCREVKLGKTTFEYSQIFNDGYWSGGQLKFLKTTFTIGKKPFVIDGLGVQSFRVKQKGNWVISRDGIKNWVEFIAEKINESEEGYSAEVDPEDPFGINFYLPSGETADEIQMFVHQRPKGELSTYVSPVLGDLNNDPSSYGWTNYDPSRGIFNLKPEENTTTVCDGK